MTGNQWVSFRSWVVPGRAICPRSGGYGAQLAAAMLLTLAVGCGRAGPDLAPVHGVVTFQGKPLVEAEVMFVPRQGGRPAIGRTNEQGQFELTTFKEKDGSLLGEHDVIIAKMAPAPTVPTGRANPANPAANVVPVDLLPDPSPGTVPRKWLIPMRYGSAKTSGLSAKVAAGGNAFQFDLTP